MTFLRHLYKYIFLHLYVFEWAWWQKESHTEQNGIDGRMKYFKGCFAQGHIKQAECGSAVRCRASVTDSGAPVWDVLGYKSAF